MRMIIATIFFAFLAAQSPAQDFPKIAPEYCECYSSIEDSVHTEYVKYIIAASTEPQFSVAYFKAISAHGKDFASNGMRSWTQLKMKMVDQDTEIGKCAASLNSKYFQYLSEDSKKREFYLGILEELERTGKCGFYAAMLRSVYRQSE
jgi:hypothetical protein